MNPLRIESARSARGWAALAAGDDGPPVLALHGWLDNAHSFLPLSEGLDGMRLVCPDFAGHGLSDPVPAGTRYLFDDHVFDVLAMADALGWDRFHLIGHSLGGAVACIAAAACPDRVLSVTAIEGLGPLSAPPDTAAAAWRKALDSSQWRPRRVHADADAAAEARTRNGHLGIEHARLLAERGTEPVDGGIRWRHDLRLTWSSPHRYTEPQVLDLLGTIACPVLSFHAEPATGILSPELRRRRLAAVGRRTAIGLRGGHHLHMECPQRLAPPIMDHIHACPPRQPTD